MRTRSTVFSIVGLMVLAFLVSPVEAGSRHSHGHGRARVSLHLYPFSWGYWGPWYGGHYAPHAYPRPALAIRDVGAIDLKVKPKKTSVYVDGELAGNAGRFDGFPGYLWLDEGEHQIVLQHEGYLTVAKMIEVREGTLTDISLRMKPGESQPAEQYFVVPKEEERVSTRAAASRSVESERSVRESRRSRSTIASEESLDARDESARLRVEIVPQDASIYLDDRFLGTASDLTRLHAGILVSPGDHTLSAVHPGYVQSEVEFSAESAEELVLRIDLRPE